MDRGTQGELDAAMLGTRLVTRPPIYARALRTLELVLHLAAWATVIASLVLDGLADGFDPQRVIGEVRHYNWRHSTADAVLVAFFTAAAGGIAALNLRPVAGLAISCLALGASIAKNCMLRDGGLRSACAICALAATGCVALATLLQVVRARRRRSLLELRLDPDEETTSTDDPLGLVVPANTYTRRAADGSSAGASVGRLVSLALPERCMIVVATFALFGSTASQMAMPALVGSLLNTVISPEQHEPYDALAKVTLELIFIFGVGAFFSFWRGYLFTLAGERVVARLRKALFSHIISLEVGFFDNSQTGELLNRLSSDTAVLQNAVTVNTSMGLRFAAQVIVALIAVFWLSWSLTLVMLSVVPAVLVAAILYGRFIKTIAKLYQERLADASSIAQEKLGAVRTVRSFAQEPHECVQYSSAVHASYVQGARRALGYGIFIGSIGLVGQSAVILVLWYGGTLVLRDHGTPDGFNAGKLMSFLLYTVMIAVALGGLSDLFSSLMNAVGASERIFNIFDRVSTVSNQGGEILSDYRGVLQLKDVTFSYPTRPDVLVLDRVSLTIQPGTVAALCGPSGSGKSSVISLIERFYDPQGGVVLLDDTPLSQLDASWWRKQAALVAQEPVLFGCSVQDNITYGCAAVTHDAVVRAARTANAHTFISMFPEAYATKVGERGVQLSGGQKQRIAIARALLVDPRFLLLDEATSALDAESEHVVQEAIDRLMANRTTVVVAHRLSTIAGADTICVVQKGRIVERGAHDELIQLDGVYKALVSRQLAGKGESVGSSLHAGRSSIDNEVTEDEHATAPTS